MATSYYGSMLPDPLTISCRWCVITVSHPHWLLCMICLFQLHGNFITLECAIEVSDNLKSRYVHTRFTSEGAEWPPDQPKHFTCHVYH